MDVVKKVAKNVNRWKYISWVLSFLTLGLLSGVICLSFIRPVKKITETETVEVTKPDPRDTPILIASTSIRNGDKCYNVNFGDEERYPRGQLLITETDVFYIVVGYDSDAYKLQNSSDRLW